MKIINYKDLKDLALLSCEFNAFNENEFSMLGPYKIKSFYYLRVLNEYRKKFGQDIVFENNDLPEKAAIAFYNLKIFFSNFKSFEENQVNPNKEEILKYRGEPKSAYYKIGADSIVPIIASFESLIISMRSYIECVDYFINELYFFATGDKPKNFEVLAKILDRNENDILKLTDRYRNKFAHKITWHLGVQFIDKQNRTVPCFYYYSLKKQRIKEVVTISEIQSAYETLCVMGEKIEKYLKSLII